MRRLTIILLACAVFAASSAAAPPVGKANADFLAANAKKPGVVTMPGIQYRVIKKGTGAQPGREDCATVAYKGTLIDGKVFDATKPGEHVSFPVGDVIAGWTEALQMMHEGDEWQLVVPPGLAYGHEGAGHGAIAPDQVLIFDVSLIKVTHGVAGQCG